jgi:hypothetical protein
MIEMSTEFELPPTGKPTEVPGDQLAPFVNFVIGTSRLISFELGPSVRMAYLVEGVGALARLNLRPISGGLTWLAKLGWGPRGAREHIEFRVVGAIRWVADPNEYAWLGRARRK